MRTNVKLIAAAGIAALTLVSCGSNNSALTDGGKVSILKPGATTTTTTSASAAYGFNASKTAFTLPHNLGLLPASELALAKVHPTYAEGLANPNDWGHSSSVGTLVAPWYYIGPNGAKLAVYGAEITNEKNWFGSPGGTLQTLLPSGYVIHTANISINASTLNSIPASLPFYSVTSNAPDVLMPTGLAFEAAPVGSLDIGGHKATAFCVPGPVALVRNNKIVDFPPLPVITAGPSTVFTMTGFHTGHFSQYDKGVTSCASFS